MNNQPTPETKSFYVTAFDAEDWAEKCIRLEKERDEAREKAERYRLDANALMLQRDEARDALMRIEDLFIDGTDIYADREKMGMIARSALEETK